MGWENLEARPVLLQTVAVNALASGFTQELQNAINMIIQNGYKIIDVQVVHSGHFGHKIGYVFYQ